MENKIDKNALRKQVRLAIAAMTAEEKAREEDAIWQQVESSPLFVQANTLLLYWSLNNEVATHAFIEKWCKQKTILLPVVNGENLDLKRYEGIQTMTEGAYGILEPTGANWTDYEAIDLNIVPGVVFDKEGHRMGHGKGYYDRLLCHINTPKMGVCYKAQLVEDLPVEPWDQPMDKVIYSKD